MNGMFIPLHGTIPKLNECRVLYADKLEGYLKLDDFNEIDVALLD